MDALDIKMRFDIFKKIRKLFSKQDKRGIVLMKIKEESNKVDYNYDWKKLRNKIDNRDKLSKMFG